MITDSKISPDINYDMMGRVHLKRGTFYIDNTFEIPDCNNGVIAASQRELVYRQRVQICRHQVWCDVSKLRHFHRIRADLGEWDEHHNTVHLFNYVPLDPKYSEGVRTLKRKMLNDIDTVYHEIRHAYNNRCMLIHGNDCLYPTWALDELMTTMAGMLADWSDMPEITGNTASIRVNYTFGPTFNKNIARDALESSAFEGLRHLKNDRDYQQSWIDFESDPQKNFIRYTPGNPDKARQAMRIFFFHDRSMDIYNCINPKLRRQIDRFIYNRPNIGHTHRQRTHE